MYSECSLKPPRTASRDRKNEREEERERGRQRKLTQAEILAAAYTLLSRCLYRRSICPPLSLSLHFSFSLANIAHAPFIAVNSGIYASPNYLGYAPKKGDIDRRVATGWLQLLLLIDTLSS